MLFQLLKNYLQRRKDASKLAQIPEIKQISTPEGRNVQIHFLKHEAPNNFALRFNPRLLRFKSFESMIKENYNTLGNFPCNQDIETIIHTFREQCWDKKGNASRFAKKTGLERVYFCVGDMIQIEDQYFLLDSKSQIQHLNLTFTEENGQWADHCSPA